jgi:hypothetical protein
MKTGGFSKPKSPKALSPDSRDSSSPSTPIFHWGQAGPRSSSPADDFNVSPTASSNSIPAVTNAPPPAPAAADPNSARDEEPDIGFIPSFYSASSRRGGSNPGPRRFG